MRRRRRRKPVPTTMISYFRLFAGLTSFRFALCRVHFSANVPRELSILTSSDCFLLLGEKDIDRDERKQRRYADSEYHPKCLNERRVFRVAHAKRLKRTRETMHQMERQKNHRKHVKTGIERVGKRRVRQFVIRRRNAVRNLLTDEKRLRCTTRKTKTMPPVTPMLRIMMCCSRRGLSPRTCQVHASSGCEA